MIRFFGADIDETDEAKAIPVICSEIIDKVRVCKAYEDQHCRKDRPQVMTFKELQQKYEHEPYKTLRTLYQAFENEFHKLPYSILYKVEACMMAGMDSSDQDYDAFDIGNGDSISLKDYDGLAYYYDIPFNVNEGGNADICIEYICSKRDLDKYLSSYLTASGQ